MAITKEIARAMQMSLDPIAKPDNLISALARAQSEMPNATLNKVNPHFKNKYADLVALRDASLPSLNRNGLAIIQFTSVEDGNLFLHTRLAHTSGEFIEGVYPLPMALDKPQAMGSALTYAKRYGWGTILGLASEEDDDATAAQGVGNGKLKTAHKLRKEEVYPPVEGGIRACETVEQLRSFGTTLGGRIIDWPEPWKMHVRDEYARRMTELTEGVTEEGTPIKTQLKASLEAEDVEPL